MKDNIIEVGIAVNTTQVERAIKLTKELIKLQKQVKPEPTIRSVEKKKGRTL